MSPSSIASRAARAGIVLTSALAFLPPLVTRLVMGQSFYLTGRGKLANFARTVEFFAGLGIPMPELNAAFVSRLEFYGGILLVVGLATRIVAAGLASTMVVALATADRQSFVDALRMTGDGGLTDVVPFVYLMFLVWLVIAGPGSLSVDALLGRRLRRWPSPSARATANPQAARA